MSGSAIWYVYSCLQATHKRPYTENFSRVILKKAGIDY